MDPKRREPPEAEDERFDADFALALGRAIKVFRTGLGIGRRELAEAAALSYSYVTEIENGKKQASATAQKALAAALGLSVSELLAAAEEWVGQLRGASVAELKGAVMFDNAQLHAFGLPLRSPALRGIAESRVAEDGARGRQLRWFQSAARQAHAARRESVLAAEQAEPAEDEAASVQTTLERLAPLLAQMEPGDRQRVVDLARRLTRR